MGRGLRALLRDSKPGAWPKRSGVLFLFLFPIFSLSLPLPFRSTVFYQHKDAVVGSILYRSSHFCGQRNNQFPTAEGIIRNDNWTARYKRHKEFAFPSGRPGENTTAEWNKVFYGRRIRGDDTFVECRNKSAYRLICRVAKVHSSSAAPTFIPLIVINFISRPLVWRRYHRGPSRRNMCEELRKSIRVASNPSPRDSMSDSSHVVSSSTTELWNVNHEAAETEWLEREAKGLKREGTSQSIPSPVGWGIDSQVLSRPKVTMCIDVSISLQSLPTFEKIEKEVDIQEPGRAHFFQILCI